MSYQAVDHVLKHSKTEGSARLVMILLAHCCDSRHATLICQPSLEALRKMARLTERNLCYVLGQLETLGEIRRDRTNGGRNRTTHYTIICHQNSEAAFSVDDTTNPEAQFSVSDETNSEVPISVREPQTLKPISEGTLKLTSEAIKVLENKKKNTSPNGAADSDELNPSELNHGYPKKRKISASPAALGVNQTIGTFHDLYLAKFGAKPDIVGGRDGKILSDLIKSHGADEVQFLLRLFFDRPPASVEKNNKFTLTTFKFVYNELLAASRNGKSEMRAFG